MYCGNCLRDNALVGALRQLGHRTRMVPLYLPMRLEQADNSAGTPLFFGGINVYLEQQSALFRIAPRWLHRLFDAPRLLAWAASLAAKTRARDLGPLTLSMLRGELGNQACELEELVNWLKASAEADVVCLSNALLAGLARRIKGELGLPVVCFLQGEDSFLNALPDYHRETAWRTLAERAAEIGPSACGSSITASNWTATAMSKAARQRLAPPAGRYWGISRGCARRKGWIRSSRRFCF